MPITSQVLPTEVLQVLTELLIQEAKPRRVGRSFVATDNIGRGKKTYQYREFTASHNISEVSEGAEFPLNDIEYTVKSADVKKIGEGIWLTKEEVDAANNDPASLNMNQIATQTGTSLALDEDNRIIQALLNDAGETFSAANAWDSTSKTPYEDVNAALTALENNNIMNATHLVLHPNEVSDLRTYDADQQRRHIDMIEPLVGEIVKTPSISTGSGLLLNADMQAGTLALAEDIAVEGPEYSQRNQTYLINVYERVVPVATRPPAIVKLSGI